MFQKLQEYYDTVRDRKISDLFDPARFEDFSLSAGDVFLDYSKTNIDKISRRLLVDLAQDRALGSWRDQMFSGAHINDTEDRAVLHVALRAPRDAVILENGMNVVPEIWRVRDEMIRFAQGVRAGAITASDGKPFEDIVNIGIGGSDLGPVMICRALSPYHGGPRVHFVSNIDGAHVTDVLAGLDPNRTLVLIVSKTFTTIETMTNAETARHWLRDVSDTSQHFVAISSAKDRATKFGVSTERVFGFEDWVGGRYSLWGPVGLSVLLAIGAERFLELLDGAYQMDQHFKTAPLLENMPVILGLVGIWHRHICLYPTRAVLPYEERLARLPAYLQQLDMESNGKSVTKSGEPIARSGPIVWGEPGTNGQHAFYQLIHQGTDIIPCEFMVARAGHETNLAHQHKLLVANCLAQSRALMVGRSFEAALEIAQKQGFVGDEAVRQAHHRTFEGNRPSVTLLYPKLTPYVLGQIIALYEHRVFVEGAILGLNSFDQWGVELGKILAQEIAPALDCHAVPDLDYSTRGLLDYLLR